MIIYLFIFHFHFHIFWKLIFYYYNIYISITFFIIFFFFFLFSRTLCCDCSSSSSSTTTESRGGGIGMGRRCSHCSKENHNSRTCPSRGGGGSGGGGGGVKLFGVRLTDGPIIKKSASMGSLTLSSAHHHYSSSSDPPHEPDEYLSDDPAHASTFANRRGERKKGNRSINHPYQFCSHSNSISVFFSASLLIFLQICMFLCFYMIIFVKQCEYWDGSFLVFMVMKNQFGGGWWSWRVNHTFLLLWDLVLNGWKWNLVLFFVFYGCPSS